MKNVLSIILWVLAPGFLLSSFGQTWQRHIIDPNLPRPATVQIGDIDGDKDMDMVATSFSAGEVVWYDNNPSSQEWDFPSTLDDGLPGASGVQIADIDNDTLLDVVAVGNDVHDVVWYKNEGGTPIQWSKSIIDSEVFARVVYVTDIDNDQDTDVIVSAIDGYRVLLYENNNLTWKKHAIGYLDGAVCLETCDIDGDHDLDLVATSFFDYKVYWFENDPANASWYRHTIGDSIPGAWGVGVADLDNDGDPDVAATGIICDDVVWYENNWPNLPWKKHFIDASLDGAKFLSLVDIDIDGDSDLVVTGYDADVVVWYENHLPNASWTKNTIDANLNGANYVCTADMNGDTYPDVVVTAWYENRIAWYENLVVGIPPGSSNKAPAHYDLLQNYPNPFNPVTNIEFSIAESEFVTLKIYNSLGQEVATLVSQRLTAGKYKYEWDAYGLASGVYLYRIRAGDYADAKQMVLLR